MAWLSSLLPRARVAGPSPLSSHIVSAALSRPLRATFQPAYTRQLPIRRCITTSPRQNDSGDKLNERSTSDNSQQKRKSEPKTSLRRVAVEAERSRGGRRTSTGDVASTSSELEVRTVTAYCAAEQYKIPDVARILKKLGYTLDPFHTNLYPQVVHFQAPSTPSGRASTNSEIDNLGDVFIFPSGTLVAWDIPSKTATALVSHGLIPASENAHPQRVETEDLEFIEDPNSDKSNIVGDRITLGTLPLSQPVDDLPTTTSAPADDPSTHATNLTLAKIAFSSGLARSTKLAVLERSLDKYLHATRPIPTLLSRGARLPFTRSFILRKTGELFSLRAQLNLTSELTDSLPDLFWDSRAELGLEGYFDRVGRALDVGVRIRALNQKMDYAQEIAAVLRERLSEGHGLLLEWLIIALISIEVAFEVLRLWREHDPASLESLMRRYYEEALRRDERGA